jgi:hypothetical protein
MNAWQGGLLHRRPFDHAYYSAVSAIECSLWGDLFNRPV